jgi:hypothetical protein
MCNDEDCEYFDGNAGGWPGANLEAIKEAFETEVISPLVQAVPSMTLAGRLESESLTETEMESVQRGISDARGVFLEITEKEFTLRRRRLVKIEEDTWKKQLAESAVQEIEKLCYEDENRYIEVYCYNKGLKMVGEKIAPFLAGVQL